jgi:hypothetical protein
MDYVFDRCGFPYLTLPVLGLTVALLPLTRLQLGACLADAAGPAGELAALPDHAALLARNLRATPLPFGDADREGLFATELLPAEAAAVAAWLIPGGRLPSVAEWRVVCRSLQARTFSPPPAPPAGTAPGSVSGDDGAARLLDLLFRRSPPKSLLEASLMLGGVVEWARDGDAWVGLGRPRASFHSNLWSPLRETVQPLHPDARLPYFGARVVVGHAG